MTFHKIFTATTCAGLLSFAGLSSAGAATLGLTPEAPTLEASSAFIDYLEFDGDGDLSTFSAEIDGANGVSPSGIAELGLGIGFPLADPTSEATGGFDVFDEAGLFLSGETMSVGFTENVIEFQFGNLTGSGASSFGDSVLALVGFDEPLGEDPFASFEDGGSYSTSVNISDVAPIPLPAGLPLLLTGVASVGFLRRSKAR